MGDTESATAAVPAKEEIALGWRWIVCGRQNLEERFPLWIGMSALYLVGAMLLERVPFVGHLVVILLSPMLLAGALLALKAPAGTAAEPPTELPVTPPHPIDYVRNPLRQLFGAFATESRTYAAVLMGIVVLGLVAVVAICQYFVGAGSVSSGWSAARHGTASPALVLLRLLVSGVLDALLFMALVYAVHRTVYAWREPMAAIADSFRACIRRPLPIAVFAGAFLGPYIAIVGAFQVRPWLGYVLLVTLGVLLLPLFVLASYCSYRDLFPPSTARD